MRRGGRYQKGYDGGGQLHNDSPSSGERNFDSTRARGGGGRGRGGRGRGRPPGLRGKDIGLYYARKQQEKKSSQRSYISIDHHSKNDIVQMFKKMTHLHPQGVSFYARDHEESSFMETYRENLHANAANDQGSVGCNNDPPEDWEDLEASAEQLSDLSSPTSGGSRQDEYLRRELASKLASDESYKAMLRFREKLPAFKKRDEILEKLEANQVVVVSGETGCGKTTQVPQFILDKMIQSGQGSQTKIICTQPRRISAISVADRVADERGEKLGKSVGYQIRLESKLPRETGSILFCTTGIVLQWLLSNPDLDGVSHVVLDEIHERDIQCDFLLTLLKDVLERREDLKIVLMSATLNAESFANYFGGCPCVHIPGFTYPVKEFYLEDVLEMTKYDLLPELPKESSSGDNVPIWKKKRNPRRYMSDEKEKRIYEDFIMPHVRNLEASGQYSPRVITTLRHRECEKKINHKLIATLVQHIHRREDEGAVLVFVPGWEDISKVNNFLTDGKSSCCLDNAIVYPLHSLMPTTNQRAIFQRPPRGQRKIVIATNIAETSITIDDIVYVVDCGKIKMSNFDVEANIATLKPEWCSLANSRQRRGRAGRVQPGVCYHLYCKGREMTFADYMLPEMLRKRLEEVILQIKVLRLGKVEPFFAKVMDPPDPKAVRLSLELLRQINALDDTDGSEILTPLGFHLAQLPMDPQTGKMILLGAIFSCLDPVLSVAASLSFKDAFVIPLGREEEADKRRLELAGTSRSDHLMMANAIQIWEDQMRKGPRNAKDFCWDYFLSESTLKMLVNLKKQFAENLCDKCFIMSPNPKDENANRNSNNEALVRAVITAGLYPNVAFAKKRIKKGGGGGYGGPGRGGGQGGFYGGRQQQDSPKEFVVLQTAQEKRVEMHPKSVNSKTADFQYPWMVYHLKMKSSAIFIYDSSMVSPLSLVFFGQNLEQSREKLKDGTRLEVIHVDDFIKFNCEEGTFDMVRDLRETLNLLLEYKVRNPSCTNWDANTKEGALLRAIVKLLTSEVLGCSMADVEEGDDFDDYY